MSIIVYCTLETPSKDSQKLDHLAAKFNGVLIGWGGGGSWKVNRDYQFKRQEDVANFRKEVAKIPSITSEI